MHLSECEATFEAEPDAVWKVRTEPAGSGRARVVKRADAEGGFGPLLRLLAPGMRRDNAESLAALQRAAVCVAGKVMR